MGKYLPKSKVVIGFGSILLFRFSVVDVFRNVDKPVSEFDFSIEKYDILGMDLCMDEILSVKVICALKERGKCVDEFIFGKQLPVEGAFAVLQFNYHVRLWLWIKKPVPVEQWSEKMGV